MKKKVQKILSTLAVIGVMLTLIMIFIEDPSDRIGISVIFVSVYCIIQLMS